MSKTNHIVHFDEAETLLLHVRHHTKFRKCTNDLGSLILTAIAIMRWYDRPLVALIDIFIKPCQSMIKTIEKHMQSYKCSSLLAFIEHCDHTHNNQNL